MIRSVLHTFILTGLLFGSAVCSAQIEREGSPVLWNILPGGGAGISWEVLPPLDIPRLLQEDNNVVGLKSEPYRFAEAVSVEYSTAHNGEWRNLSNGDRVWLLGLQCDNALALSVQFGHIDIPKGGTVYLYNSDHSDFTGPLTSDQNRSHRRFGIAPVAGNKLIVEYYEPFAHRGQGELVISSVARSYRDAEVKPVFPGNECVKWNNNTLADAAQSVVLVMVDNGQRAISATLLNNGAHDGDPFVVTAIQGLVGDSDSWVFVHGISRNCGEGQLCWDRFISGAEVVREDGATGLVLLRLLDFPRLKWKAYLAGWSLKPPAGDTYTCIQHAYAIPATTSVFEGSPVADYWSSFSTVRIDGWDAGGTFSGSLGSPLFNSLGELVGVFVGGSATCAQSSGDHFGTLAKSWRSFSSFLDPFNGGSQTLQGIYPSFDRANEGGGQPELILYPNPSSGRVFIHNNSDEPILEISFLDLSGRVVFNSQPEQPYFEVGDLGAGVYLIRIRQSAGETVRRLVVR